MPLEELEAEEELEDDEVLEAEEELEDDVLEEDEDEEVDPVLFFSASPPHALRNMSEEHNTNNRFKPPLEPLTEATLAAVNLFRFLKLNMRFPCYLPVVLKVLIVKITR